MAKNKSIFSFGKHSAGGLLDGKKKEQRTRGVNARRMHRALSILLAATMLFHTLFTEGLVVSAAGEENTPDLELFGQKVSSGDSGEGWNYSEGVLTLENYHSDDSAESFIRILNSPMDFKIDLKGENSVKTSGTLCYGNVRGCTTITGEAGASLSLEGQNWNDNDIVIQNVAVDVTTKGMIFLAKGMLIDNATVNINMNGSNGYIYTTHGGFTIQNGSDVTIMNASGAADYCVATNTAEITDSTLNITNPGGFGVYVTALSQQVTEYKAFITNSTITADAPNAGIHCEEEVSVTNSQVTNSGQFLIRSKKVIIVDDQSTMQGITYGYFKADTGAVYQVYGSHTLTSNFFVAENGSFVIPEGAALTISDGVTMENNGTMHIHDKNSLTGSGVLAGSGNFQIDVNEDLISIPEGLVYTGKDYTDRITLEGAVTVCGKEFAADTQGWTYSVEPEVVKDAGDYTVTLTNGVESVSRTFTVAECPHSGLVFQSLGDGGHRGTCSDCGYEKTEEHTIALSATASGSTVTVNKGCAICGYSEKLGSAVFTFENLTCKNPDAKVSWTKDGPAALSVTLKIDNAADYAIQAYDTAYSCSLTDLFGSIPVTAGDHILKVLFCDDDSGLISECGLPFTVTPATLTDSMVTQDKTEVTYNGAEQKPIITVRHGETALIEGTDYEVSYTRGGVVTTDFTNAGTVTVTMKGKGNYDGTVEKTFTIEKAQQTGFAVEGVTRQYEKNGTVTLSATGGEGDGTILYRVPENNGVLMVSGGKVVIIGTGTVTVTAVRAESGNYKEATATATVTITKAPAPSITYPAAGSITYGQSLSDSALTGGSTEYGTFAWENGSTVPDAGGADYLMHFIASEETKKNYEAITDIARNVAVSVAKKTLTVTADEKTVVKGETMPEFTYHVSGLVNGDAFTANPSMTTDAADTDTPGKYDIVISGGMLQNSENYQITYVNGTLNIVERPDTVTVTGGSGTTADDKKDDSRAERITTAIKADGTVVITTERTAGDGSVTVKAELKNDTTGVEATVNVAKDAAGTVTSARAAVTQKSEDKTIKIQADLVAWIVEAAGTREVVIQTKIVDAQGNTVCRLTVNAGDLQTGSWFRVLKYDSRTGQMVLVNKSTYQVDKDGNLVIDNLKKASYKVVTRSEEEAFSKAVLKTVKAASTKKIMTAGKKSKMKLYQGLNMGNVAKLTYATSKKSVAAVSKKGTITAKKAGKATIQVTVTLNNGKKKTVKMTVTVKAPKKE